MPGLPGKNSVFVDPDPKGDRAARRFINTITYECGVIAKLAGAAQSARSKPTVSNFNTCRETLERTVNSLRQCTDISAALEPKVIHALRIGDAALETHLPAPPVVTQSDTSLNRSNNNENNSVQNLPAPTETLQPLGTRIMDELTTDLPTDPRPSTERPNSGERVAENCPGTGPTGFGVASAGGPTIFRSNLSTEAPRAYGRSQGDAAHRAAPASDNSTPTPQNDTAAFDPEAERAELRRQFSEMRDVMINLRQRMKQMGEIIEESENIEEIEEIHPPPDPQSVSPPISQTDHPNDRTQNQLKSRLLNLSVETVPPDCVAGSVSFSNSPTTAPAQHHNAQPAISNQPTQSRSTHSNQSANPYAYLTPSQNNPNSNMGGGDSDLAASLLTVSLRTHSRELMMMGRPDKEKRFSGKPGEDFESVMATFDRVTNLPGITDDMRCLELGHWLSGNPLIILTQYDKIKEADVAYREIRTHLDRIYGRKVFTAKEMTADLTKGNRLKDPEDIEEFLLKLEKIYVDAVATHRDATFSTNDTYSEILQKKLPNFYVLKWATKKTKADNEYMKDKTKPYGLNFPTFVAFCREINDTSRNQLAITGSTKNEKGQNNNQPTRTHSIAVTSAQPAAPGNKPNFQGGKGRGKNHPSKPGRNNQTQQQPTQAQPASTRNPSNQNKPQNPSTNTTTKPPPRNPTPPARVPGSCHCVKCNVSTHATIKCHGMWGMDRDGRTKVVKEAKACFRCFEADHFSKNCPKPILCTECQSDRHNALFHIDAEK